MKTFTSFFIPLLAVIFFLNFNKKPEIGQQLAISLGSSIYNDFDTTAYDLVFKKEFKLLSEKYINVSKLNNYYQEVNNQPRFIASCFEDKSLDSLIKYLAKSTAHGFNPKVFHFEEITALTARLKANDYKNVSENYELLARLDILASDAFTRYTRYLKFGAVNPKDIFTRYYIAVKQPDSTFNACLLKAPAILDTLTVLQHKSPQYKSLQHAYLSSRNDSLKKILLVNMERLRWVMPSAGEKFIQVNIPDFRLFYFCGSDTLISMKVCVGEKRDLNYDEQQKIFARTGDLDDKPQNKETPLLFSQIKKLYTNPVWNIPESIVQEEIYPMARRSSRYLMRKNIAVFRNNKRIENPATIKWYKYNRDKIPFLFVQQPGTNNSLGRLKFIFPNSSSVYLHDTNFKQGFKLTNRAISHGCIRLEKPLELARLLVEDSLKYDSIRSELNLKPLKVFVATGKKTKSIATDKEEERSTFQFVPKAETPILITYFTAWFQNNKIQYRPDVYGMDEKLWLAMKKFR
ncbi:L,D-transpeptidase family protein [Pedobacter sp. Leaf194]|uniref:L,D-transpeptidase family protein n=1 Tax=Pedobacter sp. Leaf194 TaxID=1736297 RepID=UPI000702BAF5|nr:L,D-transpeptidase family protein [Pedobacter sp. Leaf194]KQS35814.1 hypothetical protein ASG14_10140 [Pedobacter sp. Leaf194]